MYFSFFCRSRNSSDMLKLFQSKVRISILWTFCWKHMRRRKFKFIFVDLYNLYFGLWNYSLSHLEIIKKYGSMKGSVKVGFPVVYMQVYKLTEKPFDREDEKKRSIRLCTPPFFQINLFLVMILFGSVLFVLK